MRLKSPTTTREQFMLSPRRLTFTRKSSICCLRIRTGLVQRLTPLILLFTLQLELLHTTAVLLQLQVRAALIIIFKDAF